METAAGDWGSRFSDLKLEFSAVRAERTMATAEYDRSVSPRLLYAGPGSFLSRSLHMIARSTPEQIHMFRLRG